LARWGGAELLPLADPGIPVNVVPAVSSASTVVAPSRKKIGFRNVQMGIENTPFAANYDRPEQAERVIWRTLTALAVANVAVSYAL